MSAPRISRAAAAVLLLSGCAGSPGPRQHLLTAEQSVRTSYGGWVEVDRPGADRESSPRLQVEGELLAASADTLHVLTASGAVMVLREPQDRLRLICEWNQTERIVLHCGLESLACAANGFYAVFTMPLTWIVGVGASRTQARVGVLRIDAGDWGACRECARFPQGLPPGLDPSRLHLPSRWRPSGRSPH